MYDLRNDDVPGDSVIKIKMLQTDGLLLSVCALPPCVNFGGSPPDGLASAVIVAAFPSVVPAPPATTTPSRCLYDAQTVPIGRRYTSQEPHFASTHAVVSRAGRWFTTSYWCFNKRELIRRYNLPR
jgi:hypothetical protein